MKEGFSREPKSKGGLKKWLTGAFAALATLGSAPDAYAGNNNNRDAFVGGLVNGFVNSARQADRTKRCLEDNARFSGTNISNVESNASFDAERVNERADLDLLSLTNRTDISEAEKAIRRRQIETDRQQGLAYDARRVQDAYDDAERQRRACYPQGGW